MTKQAEGGRKRVRMDYEERRRSILHAAAGLFRCRPYSDVSISDIAEEAGVARGLLHHYFDSKRDLYLEVVRHTARIPQIAAPAANGGETDERAPAEAIVRNVEALLALFEENGAHWLDAIIGGPEQDEELEAILDGSREIIAEQTIAALGLVDDDSPELRALVRGFGGLVHEVTNEWLVRGRLDKDQARTIILDTLPLLIERILPAIRP